MTGGLKRLIVAISVLFLFTSVVPVPNTWGTAWINVKRVIDGDTFKGDILNLPKWVGEDVYFRVYGVDTPERGWRASCPLEFVLAEKCVSIAEEKVIGIQQVEISRKDKYGRFLIKLPEYTDILLRDSIAYPYLGGTKQNYFCKD